MKVMTILGTRPEIIRLCLIIKKLDKFTEHTLVHTGQNYTLSLNEIFFRDLNLRAPNYYLGADSNMFSEQVAKIFSEAGKLMQSIKPDKVLILGDTNSGLAAIVAERMGIPVYHMEAGNRCYDLKVPEEKNRKVIDAISSFALPYTPGSRDNLLREGVPKEKIYVSGNPIYEVLTAYSDKIDSSKIMDELGLTPKNYFLVTMHRAENVDSKERLKDVVTALEMVSDKYKLPVVYSVHPRAKNKLEQHGLISEKNKIMYLDPLGFFDFVKLEKNAKCVMSDSGTVQEECCIFRIPAVTIRDTTERPETVKCGSNLVSGLKPNDVLKCLDTMLNRDNNWDFPEGYIDSDTSEKILKFILGERHV